MKALIQELVAKANLDPAQAEKVAGVVREFVGSKLPEPLRPHLEAALNGERIESAVDAAKSLVGGFLK